MSDAAQVISGIDAMRGVGQQRAKGFWADVWDRVLRRGGARFGLAWISIVAFFAVFAPLLANAHPWILERTGPGGAVVSRSSPLLANLSAPDWTLLIGTLVGVPWLLVGARRFSRGQRIGVLVVASLQAGAIVALAPALIAWCSDPARGEGLKAFARSAGGEWTIAALIGLGAAAAAAWVPTALSRGPRVMLALAVAALATVLSVKAGGATLVNFERYLEQEAAGEIRCIWAPIPWSPKYSRSDMIAAAPGARVEDLPNLSAWKGTPFGARRTLLGTDALGGDVLAQMLWACRLSISIGLVSTGISVLIGVTIGSIMGYFGGWVDMILFRMVEIFMAVPVLFLLIVAAGVLPRDTYVMMAIIGLFSWTGAARFTRAEFLRLRQQDFVQSARAVGLPVKDILFKHMLPNGITPVLVDASFGIAAAISVEATLSYLGLGPDGQASWGKLLSSATAATGTFVWWLAVFPGVAIFLSVLSYNLLGEALRDAIDPKLRKAAH
jgi:peptide/nickel transport system permease protein